MINAENAFQKWERLFPIVWSQRWWRRPSRAETIGKWRQGKWAGFSQPRAGPDINRNPIQMFRLQIQPHEYIFFLFRNIIFKENVRCERFFSF